MKSSRELDVYSEQYAANWAGAAPFEHASGIWGRGRLLQHTARIINRGDTVIDLGCGAGLATSFFSPIAGENGVVKGYDNSAPLIAYAKELECTFLNLSFEIVDVSCNFPDKDNSVDCFASFMLIQNLQITQIQKVFSECHRCLRRNGRLVFLTLHPNFFEEQWDLSFISYDNRKTEHWRQNQEPDVRIDGWLQTTKGTRKPVFAYPHKRKDIEAALLSTNMTLCNETEIYIDVATAIKKFGKESIVQLPTGPLFWILEAVPN